MVKKLCANAGDLGLIPGSGRSSGEGNGNLLQYSCWELPWKEESGGTTVYGVEKELGMTEWLNNNNKHIYMHHFAVYLKLTQLCKTTMCCAVLSHFSCVWFFATLWTVDFGPHGLCNPMRHHDSPWLLNPWNSPGKNTGVDWYAFLQGIFPIQRLNMCLLHLLHCRWVLYHWATGESQLTIPQ